jgi:hypothetical protein
MIMPNFLIIGAAKSGTTSLYYWLKQHPQIYMAPVKETNFFAFEGEKLDFPEIARARAYLANCKTTIEAYREQFQGVSNEIAIGEASPIYLYHPQAPERIQHYVPNAKLIAILRNPIERAYSNFLHCLREDLEYTTDFNQALQAEEGRIRNNWWWGFHYVNIGFYYVQLKRYFDRFDANQIKVYLYDDLKSDPLSLIQDILQFLDVDATFVPDISMQYNKTGIPKNKFLHQFLSKPSIPSIIKNPIRLLLPIELRKRILLNINNRNLFKPRLSLEVRSQLINLYREDILKLQDLIERDLTRWMKESDS